MQSPSTLASSATQTAASPCGGHSQTLTRIVCASIATVDNVFSLSLSSPAVAAWILSCEHRNRLSPDTSGIPVDIACRIRLAHQPAKKMAEVSQQLGLLLLL